MLSSWVQGYEIERKSDKLYYFVSLTHYAMPVNLSCAHTLGKRRTDHH